MTGVLLALSAGACFGLSNVTGRMAITRSSVYHAAIWSVLVTSAVLAVPLVVLLATRDDAGLRFAGLGYFVAAGAVADFLARFSLYSVSARIGASRAAAFRGIAPIFTLAFGVVFLGDRVSPLLAVGLALMLSGLAVVHADAARRSSRASVGDVPAVSGRGIAAWLARGGPTRQGLLFGLLAALAFATGDLLRNAGIDAGGDAFVGAFTTATTALALHLVRGLATGQLRSVSPPDRTALPLLLVTGLCVLAAVVLFLSALRSLSAGVAASVSGTQILFAIVFGRVLNQSVEGVSRRVALGGLLVFAGFCVVLRG